MQVHVDGGHASRVPVTHNIHSPAIAQCKTGTYIEAARQAGVACYIYKRCWTCCMLLN